MAAVTQFPQEITKLLHHLELGQDDPVYFAEKVMGVRLNPAQRRWYRLCARMSGDVWAFRRVWHLAANQIGKTVGLAILILWAGHYKKGIARGNWDYWLSSPYLWLHLSPTHPISLLLRDDLKALTEGSHPAQFDRKTGKRHEVLWPSSWCQEVKFDDGQYAGFKLWNGAELHFRTTADGAKGIQGKRAHGVSMDECAYEDNLLSILKGTIKMRLASTGGPFWGVSTSNGMNDYYELVEEVRQQGAQGEHERVWEFPAKRSALVISHITDNSGYGLDPEEVQFMIEDQKGDPISTQTLWGGFVNPQDAFFVPSDAILKAWSPLIKDESGPRPGHRYIIFWDPSVASDPTVLVIIDVTRKPWRGVYFERWETPMATPALIQEMVEVHRKWNTMPEGKVGFPPRAMTGYDGTSMGGKMIAQLLEQITPKRAYNFAGPKAKINALTNMRAAMSQQEVIVPLTWLRLQREVLNYKLDDKKLVQDAVMAMAGALQLAAQGFSGETKRPFVTGYRTGGGN